jgi:long-chain acyl-CoA synthetase
MKGYLNHNTENDFFEDYFRTGDWGYKDCEGYIYLKSRKKDLINVGGKKVSPIEVEEQILRINGIADCACVGVPDPEGILGEVVKAFIVKDSVTNITFEEISTQLQGCLESYKLPAQYQWTNEIPKTQNGKIQRFLLT